MTYPLLEFNLHKLRNNARIVLDMCAKNHITVAGIVKGFNAIPAGALAMAEEGCSQIGSSRIRQLKTLKQLGMRTPTMLIRIPMISEAGEVVRYADYSLNSNIETLKVLNEEAFRLERRHKVVLMYDVGDLREGFFYRKEVVDAAVYVEQKLPSLELAGVGMNVGCYGSTKPTRTNLEELSSAAKEIEERIGRALEMVSGGGSTTLTTLAENQVPEKINHLRIGEAIANAQDLPKYWGLDIEGMDKDTFILKTQIVEVYEKPTYPIGELCVDAFGRRPVYENRGIRKRAIIAIGNQDTWDSSRLVPKDKNIIVVGASSDHTILDVQDSRNNYRVGDIVEFNVLYQSMLFTTMSPLVEVEIIQ